MRKVIKIAMAIMLALVICSLVIQVAMAEQVSMIMGRITVNGQPQDNIAVSGFCSTAHTGPDGQYVLKFESAGAGVINASYDGYHTSSGLIVIPSSPVIKVKDLDIAIPVSPAGSEDESGIVQHTMAATAWTRVPAPTASADDLKLTGQDQPFDMSGIVIVFTGALCTVLILFLIYLTVRK